VKILSTVLFILLPVVLPVSLPAAENQQLSAAQAREEVRLAVEQILRYHPDPFHDTAKKDFYGEVEALMERQGEVMVAEQYFGLARLFSMVSDTHTQLHVSEETPAFQATFPLRFRIFPDGLYIIAASDDYKAAIGKKIVSISGRNPDQVLDELARHSFSDNWPRKRVFAEMYLYLPETYDVFHLKTEEGVVELTLEDATGEKSALVLAETWDRGLDDFGWDTLNPFLPEDLLTVQDLNGMDLPYFRQSC
jgi:hypothetical protein